jgi:hypothetical protein
MSSGAEAHVDFVAFAAVRAKALTYQSRPDTERMIKGSWFPTLAAKTKTRQGWGTHDS